MNYQYSSETQAAMLDIIELIPWETNQYIAKCCKVPIEDVRHVRSELKRHNRHDVDDEEIGVQQW